METCNMTVSLSPIGAGDMIAKGIVNGNLSGSSLGAMFRFDWGAGGNFVESVRSILQPYEIHISILKKEEFS